MYKLEIEQGYNRVEFEFKSIHHASEVIEFLRDGITKETKFIITNIVEEEGEQNEHLRKINENPNRD